MFYRSTYAYKYLGTKSLYFKRPSATVHYPLPVEVETVAKVIDYMLFITIL